MVINIMKKITAVLLALVMLTGLAACAKKKDRDDTLRGAEEAVTTPEADETPALWSDTTTVTASMFTYYFNAYFKTFTQRYKSHLDTLGLDPSKDLKEQMFQGERTWYEYLVLLCWEEVKDTVALADAAKAAGMKLSDEDLEEINAALTAYDDLAEDAGMDTDAYLASVFGSSVSRATAEKCMRLKQTAMVYYETLAADDEPDAEQCEKYFLSDPDRFLYYDCLRVVVPDEDVSALSGCRNEKEFTEAIRSAITKNNFSGNYDGYKEKIDELTEGKLKVRCAYNSSSNQDKWAHDPERAPYDIYTEQVYEGSTAVCMILPASENGKYSEVLYRDAENVRNMKYILIDDEAEAADVYNEWAKDGGEKAFDKLINKYKGGKAENIDRGDYPKEMTDWIFDTERKASDSTYITVEDTGTYLLYMLEEGEASWAVDVKAALGSDNVNNALDELLGKYPSEYSDALYNVEAVSIEG